MTFYERRRLFWIFSALFIALSFPILLYATGWRLTSGFTLKRTGGIFIVARESDVEIFVDGKPEKRTNFLQSSLFLQGLTPGSSAIIAAKNGYWPWAKTLEIKESAVTEAHIFLIPKELKGETLLRGNYSGVFAIPAEGILALEKLKNGKPVFDYYHPQDRTFLIDAAYNPKNFKDAARVIADRHDRVKVRISEAGDEVLSKWDSDDPLPYFFTSYEETQIFRAQSPIRMIAFYPGRRDVILLAVENGIFALELDGRGTRNFQPVYKGKKPSFAIIGNLIYIFDDERLFEIKI